MEVKIQSDRMYTSEFTVMWQAYRVPFTFHFMEENQNNVFSVYISSVAFSSCPFLAW